MSWRPQLNAVCGRCGKPRGLMHECVSNSRRKADRQAAAVVRDVPQVPQAVPGQPARPHLRAQVRLHAPQGRRTTRNSATRARKKRQQQAHDYTACGDDDCKRALCVAYKTGWKSGDEAGFDRGWQQGHEVGFKEGYAEGYAQGYPAGIADCPRDHK